MDALHRSGYKPQALAEFERIRVYLDEQLGLESGSALRARQLAVLPDELPALPAPLGGAAVAPVGSTSGPGWPPVPAQLPPSVAGFAGRERELLLLDGLLDQGGTRPAAMVITAVGDTAGVGRPRWRCIGRIGWWIGSRTGSCT